MTDDDPPLPELPDKGLVLVQQIRTEGESDTDFTLEFLGRRFRIWQDADGHWRHREIVS